MTRSISKTPHPGEIYVFKVISTESNKQFLLQLPGGPQRQQEMESNDTVEQTFTDIAVLNRDAGETLSQISSKCLFSAYSPVGDWTSINSQTTTDKKESSILVDVVIYGLKVNCESVGDILNDRKMYLQEPDFRDQRLGYKNPHFIDFGVIDVKRSTILDPLDASLHQLDLPNNFALPDQHAAASRGAMRQKITAAFKTSTRAKNLKQIAADIRVRTPLLK